MNVDRMLEYEIERWDNERWENEGGNCLHTASDIAKPSVYQHRQGSSMNVAANGHHSLAVSHPQRCHDDRSNDPQSCHRVASQRSVRFATTD
ncbi:hypothetical protein [Novipirellula rosea]